MIIQNNMKYVKIKSRKNIASLINSPWFWYKLYEKTGTTVADAAGFLPTITLGGTLTNIWDNVGYLTLHSSGNDSYSTANNANNYAMFNMANWVDKQMIFSWDLYFDGGITTTETLFGFGANTTSAAAGGGWWIQINTSNQIVFNYRGDQASAVVASNMTGFNAGTDPAAGSNKRLTMTADCRIHDSSLLDIDLYCNGVSVTGLTDIDLLLNSAQHLPGYIQNQPFVLFGRKNSTASNTSDQKLGAGASNARIANIFGILRDTIDETLPLRMNTEFYYHPGDYPLCLEAA